MTDNKLRVRFAPSPTGSLHVGGARTAMYNYLLAKKNNGDFVLRIEDTDEERSTQESIDSLIKELNWLGLTHNEGYACNYGKYGPYKQSARLDIYQKYANQLLNEGKAYYCFLSNEEIDKQKEQAKANGNIQQISSPYRNLPLDQALAKLKTQPDATIRFKTPENKTIYKVNDLVRGPIELASTMVADFVIVRSGGMPVYNFCCAIDDALMKITHVLRGEEHLSNTLRQLMIFEALQLTTPEFAHVSIILNEQKKKLSKRDGDVSCSSFRQAGFLPEALLNYIALLGWTDPNGAEIFTLPELVEKFKIHDLNAAAPVFDQTKLTWVNTQHIKNLTPSQLLEKITPFLAAADIELPICNKWQIAAVELIQSELHTLNDACTSFNKILNNNTKIDAEAQSILHWQDSKNVINTWLENISNLKDKKISTEDTKDIIKKIQEKHNVKGKNLFMPLRIAVIGSPHGYDLKVLVPLIDRTSLITRAKKCYP